MNNLFPPDASYVSPFESMERPDIIYHNNDFVMGIECFEFDASKKTRKGSKQRNKERVVDKEQNEKLLTQYQDAKGHIVLEGHIDAGYSFENYSSSLLSTFTRHAKYIDEYRAHIIHLYPDKRAYTVFFINDNTALGNYIRTPMGLQVLYPLLVKDFITTISQTSSLDYIVLKFKQRIYEPLLLIVKNEARYLDMFKQECFNPETDTFIQYTYEHEGHIHRLPEK